ncbi:unnamed protein product [Psylliodes chrysocephalus]|uniref:Uncharacterized protein n=1 Tax=Psylliodes chrysocephalus TaxID=3402493 RepID=A0A9P0G7Y1_9CUCU|nr:unnamed protein product [Psylliodes chrysocephala]
MWKIGGIVLMIVLASRPTNGHVEDLLFENDADLDWPENDIWIAQQNNEDDSPRTLLERLCEHYDLAYKNEVIDCNQLQINLKPLKIDQHNLRKREADEEVEGSGEEDKGDEQPSHPSEHEIETETAPKETEKSKEETKSEPESKAAVEKTEASETPIPGVEPLQTTAASAEKVPAAEEPKSEEAKTQETDVKPDETKLEEPKTDSPEAQPEESKTDGSETKPEEPKTDGSETKPEEPKTDGSEAKPEEAKTEGSVAKPEEPKTDKTEVKPGEPKTDISEAPPVDLKPDEFEPKKEVPTELLEVPAVVGVEVELSEAGKGQESNAKKGRKLTQEDLNNQQSGNALVNANGNMIDTETKVGSMKPKESIKVAAPGEEPKSGAASEGGIRKNNSLLIGLFVAVLVVGAAAFSYNFVKKRRSKATAARSEHNGTNRTADQEEGREMKPLMKTEEQKNNVEFANEK